MSAKAMLIDYEYCTGCHSCEMACKAERGLPEGRFGIKLTQIGPWEIGGKKWQYDYIPAPTDICNLCSTRVKGGKMPSCVQHCQSHVIEIGSFEEMSKLAAGKRKAVLYTR